MIACNICGDECGPWLLDHQIGWVCEDCEESGRYEQKLKELGENEQLRELRVRRPDGSEPVS